MRFVIPTLMITAIIALGLSANAAVTSSAILARVKAAEAGFKDMKAEMVIDDANKGAVSKMGKGYDDFLLLQKATVYYKKPDKMRWDGYAKSIKVTLVQNGFRRLVLGAMVRKTDNLKDAPGKRRNPLDLGLLSSWLWQDNVVSVVGTERGGIVKLKFDPKFGGTDSRHDFVWVDPDSLKIIERENYTGRGELRSKSVYRDHVMLSGKLPIATEVDMYNGDGQMLGTVSYSNVKSNVGLADSLFSLTQK